MATTTRSTNGHNPTDAEQINAAAQLLVPTRRHLYKAAAPTTEAFQEIGTTGLRQYGGFVLEEWLQQLAGRKAAWVWREMLDNDPTVGAIMFAIRWLARGVEWRVEEGNDPAAAELVESCMHDMSHTWGDFISEALSMLPYGWSFHETVYKRRQGPQAPRPSSDATGFTSTDSAGMVADTEEDDSNLASSQYDDGKIGWRKLPVRAQETLLRWHFDGYSGLSAMEQIDYHGGDHIIPIEKAVLFRTQTTRNNPEGRSVFRNAYTSYFSVKQIKQFEAIGIERDLAGIPVAKAPQDVDIFSPGQAQLFNKVKQMVTGLRRDEYEGVVLPTAWELELLSSGGSRQIDTDAVIRRYRQDIGSSMLADFILVGLDAVGSYAMVDVKSELFGVAVDGVLDLICEVMNRYAIPRLLALNGMDVSEPPEIAHGSAGRIDLEKVGSFIFQLSGAGAPIPWSDTLLGELFKAAGLPANFEEDAQEHVPVVPEPEQDAAGGEIEDETPVGPPKLPPGEESFAREAHMGEPAPVPAPGQAPAPAKPKQPVAKAATPNGTAYDLSPKLRDRHVVLSAQLEQEINTALALLGEQAATAYSRIATKASYGALHRLVGRVMRALDIPLWIDQHLKPLLQNHAGRVIADTQRTIQAEIGLEVQVGEQDAQKIAQASGENLGMRDIEPQIRDSILQAIRQGVVNGENPVKTGDRIRGLVPAGRFVNAGARYRARLIARDTTANAMRQSSVAAYRSNDHITGVRLRDGIFGPPRSDAECMARDGDTLPIDEADSAQPLHPACSLSLDPIVSDTLPVSEPEPALAA